MAQVMLDAFKKWIPHKPVAYNQQVAGNYNQRDIPSVDINSVVVYGRNPDGSVQKVQDFTFTPIHMMDGDRLELKIQIDTNFGIADLSQLEYEEPEQVLDELKERVAYWNSKL